MLKGMVVVVVEDGGFVRFPPTLVLRKHLYNNRLMSAVLTLTASQSGFQPHPEPPRDSLHLPVLSDNTICPSLLLPPYLKLSEISRLQSKHLPPDQDSQQTQSNST